MTLSQSGSATLIANCFSYCSSSVKEGFNSRSKGTLSERIVPVMMLLKGLLGDSDGLVTFTLKKDNAALFGYKATQVRLDDIELIQKHVETLKKLLGARYRACHIADAVTELKILVEQRHQGDIADYLGMVKALEKRCAIGGVKKTFTSKAHNTQSLQDFWYDPAQFDDLWDNWNESSANTKKVTASALRDKGNADIQACLDQCAYLAEAFIRLEHGTTKGYEPFFITETLFLAAMSGCVPFLKASAFCFGVPAFAIRFPREVNTLRARAMTMVDKRTVTTRANREKGSQDFFTLAIDKHRTKLEFDENVEKLMAAITCGDQDRFALHFSALLLTQFHELITGDSLIGEFFRLNHAAGNEPRLLTVKRLSQRLQDNVIGQQGAVDSVCRHLSGLVHNGGQQHLGVCTFLGVSGTGKTYLAEAVGEVFKSELGADFQVVVINMEQFTGEKDVAKLFGSGSQYVDAALGLLTLAAMKNPRTIFIFDEIEKAHGNVIQSLLSPVDKGVAVDFTAETKVDLSQCLFVFTTNLGSESIERNTKQLNIDPAELLTKKTQDDDAFSPEMVNRLSAGTIAVFHSPSAQDIVKLALSERPSKKSSLIIPPDNYAELILGTLGADASPRSIKSQWTKIEGQVIQSVSQHFSDEALTSINHIEFNMACLPKDKALKLEWVTSKTAKISCDADITISNVMHLDDIKVALSADADADAVILDVSRLPFSSKEIIQVLTCHQSKLVFVAGKKSDSTQYEILARNHNVFAWVPIERNAKAALNRAIDDVKAKVRLIKLTEHVMRNHFSADYNFKYTKKNDSIHVQLDSLTYKKKVRRADAELPFLNFAERPACRLDDMIGMKREKAQLSVIINGLGSSEDNNTFLPNGYLLAGPPGTGKTQLARCVAGESDLVCFGVDAAKLLVGNVVSNIERLFDVARRYAPSIIFIDEFDAIGLSRSASHFTNVPAVNSLLTAMQGFSQDERKVFVLAATNHPRMIDPALLRAGRFDRIIHFNLPCKEARRECIQQWVKQRGETISEPLLKELVRSTHGATVADIRHVFNDAVLNAVAQDIEWQQDSLREALRSARFGAIKNEYMQTDEQRKIIAYHEAGHLIAHKLLLPESPVEMVSIQPRGAALGMVVPALTKQSSAINKRYVKNQLQVFLAGIVAEHILGLHGDEQTTGATNDREMATRLAKQAIFNWGMSERYGFALPAELAIPESEINAEVMDWLKGAGEQVKSLICDNRVLLDSIALALIKKEVLNNEDIEAFFANNPVNAVGAAT